MVETEKLLILANVNDERRTEGFVLIKKFNKAQKLKASLKTLGLFWGAILLIAPFPVLHIVLPPILFFTGIFMARRTYKSEGRLLSGETTCPNCKGPVSVKKSELNWPITEICQSCGFVVRMQPSEH